MVMLRGGSADGPRRRWHCARKRTIVATNLRSDKAEVLEREITDRESPPVADTNPMAARCAGYTGEGLGAERMSTHQGERD